MGLGVVFEGDGGDGDGDGFLYLSFDQEDTFFLLNVKKKGA